MQFCAYVLSLGFSLNVFVLSDDILVDSNFTCLANGQINFEKSKVENIILSGSDQCQVTVQDGCGNVSPASCKSQCNVEKDSSSIKTTQSMRNNKIGKN